MVFLSRLPTNPSAEPLMPSLSLYVLAAELLANGIQVKILDTYADNPERLMDPRYIDVLDEATILGFSVDSLNWGLTKLALDSVKTNRPDIITVIGGLHTYHMPHQVASNPHVDYVVVGDGDRAFVQLVTAIKAGRKPVDIPGVFWDEDGHLMGTAPVEYDLASRPLPAYELIPKHVYPYMPFETSRGCVAKCTFCSIKQRPYRRLSVSEVSRRLEYGLEQGRKQFSDDFIYLTDDCFSGDRKRFIELCDLLASFGLQGSVGIEARIKDMLDPQCLEAAARLEPKMVELGTECGYERGLEILRKGMTAADIRECARRLDAFGLTNRTLYSFMIGLPWESDHECLKTVDFAASLVNDYGGVASLSWFSFLPSKLWQQRSDFKIELDDDVFNLPLGGQLELFDELHPNLTSLSVDKVESVIDQYKADGTKIDRIALWRH